MLERGRNVEIPFSQHQFPPCPTPTSTGKLLCYNPLLIWNQKKKLPRYGDLHFPSLLRSAHLLVCLLVVCSSLPANYQFMSLAHFLLTFLGVFNWLAGKFSFSNLFFSSFGFQRQLRTCIFDSLCITYELLFGKICLVSWLWFFWSLFSVRYREVTESW